jgi:ABC-type branched-subunit amino acid transport system ATPase component
MLAPPVADDREDAVRTRAYEHSLNSSTLPAGSPALEIRDIELRFGGVVALQDVSFTVTQGHIHSVIGPNGAGKSSLLNCVSGLYHPQQGSVTLHTGAEGVAHELTSLPPHKYGMRKRVDLGRALAMEPRVLLLDEPMAGMNSEEKEDMARFILDVREAARIPVVLVEHDMGVVMDLADRIAVLDFGAKIAEGTPQQMQRDPAVLKAYLGEGDR